MMTMTNGSQCRRRRTRSADYYVKKVANPLSFDDGAYDDSRHVLVQLWDTVGKESLTPRHRCHPARR